MSSLSPLSGPQTSTALVSRRPETSADNTVTTLAAGDALVLHQTAEPNRALSQLAVIPPAGATSRAALVGAEGFREGMAAGWQDCDDLSPTWHAPALSEDTLAELTAMQAALQTRHTHNSEIAPRLRWKPASEAIPQTPQRTVEQTSLLRQRYDSVNESASLLRAAAAVLGVPREHMIDEEGVARELIKHGKRFNRFRADITSKDVEEEILRPSAIAVAQVGAASQGIDFSTSRGLKFELRWTEEQSFGKAQQTLGYDSEGQRPSRAYYDSGHHRNLVLTISQESLGRDVRTVEVPLFQWCRALATNNTFVNRVEFAAALPRLAIEAASAPSAPSTRRNRPELVPETFAFVFTRKTEIVSATTSFSPDGAKSEHVDKTAKHSDRLTFNRNTPVRLNRVPGALRGLLRPST